MEGMQLFECIPFQGFEKVILPLFAVARVLPEPSDPLGQALESFYGVEGIVAIRGPVKQRLTYIAGGSMVLGSSCDRAEGVCPTVWMSGVLGLPVACLTSHSCWEREKKN